MPAPTYRPAPTDLNARRPAGQTYAVEVAPGPGRLVMHSTDAGHVVKTWRSLRRAQRALAQLVDYEPKHAATARVVVLN